MHQLCPQQTQKLKQVLQLHKEVGAECEVKEVTIVAINADHDVVADQSE
jgi:hypothetical protein